MMDKLKKLMRPVPLSTLSVEDLEEFNCRRVTLQNAHFQYLMVEEAYIVWSKNIREKYKLPIKFDINPTTGVVTPKKDA